MDIEDIDVFIGIDVGKAEHWATALSRGGKKVHDTAPCQHSGLLDVPARGPNHLTDNLPRHIGDKIVSG